MFCPKCRAKIGIQKQSVHTVFGNASAVGCYICGFWLQVYPEVEGEAGRYTKKGSSSGREEGLSCMN